MKKLLALLLVISAAATAAAPQPKKPAQSPSKPFMKPAVATPAPVPAPVQPVDAVTIDQISETFGHMLISQLKNTPLKLNTALVIKGMQDELAGKQAPLTQDAYDKAVNELQQKVLAAMSAVNLTMANDFLKENAKKEGVVTLVDGKLQYKIMTPGKGTAVTAHDTPQIQYEGTFMDGKVFGTSYTTNEPVWLPLDQAIPGFAQGIVGMKEGEKRQLFVSPELAYGVNGTSNIPPNTLLIFTIEVVKANKPAETPAK
ncbi:MAG: FKBP-type peptidyl-prolyl cis-trans isomerase [Chlamydiota bacterium]